MPQSSPKDSPTRPHPWTGEIDLLLEQALAFLRAEDVSTTALSRARYHQRQSGHEPPFYLRQFAGKNLGDQIVLRCSPADTLFKRRCSITIAVKGMTVGAVNAVLTGAFTKQGFTQIQANTPDCLLFSKGPLTIEVHIFFKDERASVSVQCA